MKPALTGGIQVHGLQNRRLLSYCSDQQLPHSLFCRKALFHFWNASIAGTALNCLCSGSVLKERPFRRTFIFVRRSCRANQQAQTILTYAEATPY
jgi:hypothetical protein